MADAEQQPPVQPPPEEQQPPAEAPPAEAPPAEAPPAEAPPPEAPPAEAPPAEAAPPPAEAPPAAPPAEAAPPQVEVAAATAPPPEAAAPPPAAPAGVELNAVVQESWHEGSAKVVKYAVTVTNKGAAAVGGIELEIANIAALKDSWNSKVIRVGQGLPALLGLPDHVAGLAPGASAEIGFIVVKADAGEPAFSVKAT